MQDKKLNRKNTYRTLKKETKGIYKEKGSKFIGIAVPCYSEEEAKQFLQQWHKEHYQARHLCYAYRFGMNGEVYRANDDGEPSNSAGAPILGQLQSYDLTNTLIGVVRYFGGIKLGVGGLINAYRTAAKEAIEAGEIITKEVFEWVRVNFEYPDMPGVMNCLKHHNLDQKEQVFELNCSLVTNLPLNKAREIKEELKKFDSVELIVLGEC